MDRPTQQQFIELKKHMTEPTKSPTSAELIRAAAEKLKEELEAAEQDLADTKFKIKALKAQLKKLEE